ncbi:MAG: transcriptional repressor [Bacteroidales bacterium]|nr:transcriptional repressor [Bacteroidales bacterium]
MNESAITALMQEHGIRPTANRIIVAKALAEESRPLTMTELDDRIGSIDKSGIFRTLTLFKEQHLVHVLEDGEGVRYELCHSHDHSIDNDMHVHFHCEHCGQTICLEDLPIPEVTLPDGYEVQSANFVLKGICPKCRK